MLVPLTEWASQTAEERKVVTQQTRVRQAGLHLNLRAD